MWMVLLACTGTTPDPDPVVADTGVDPTPEICDDGLDNDADGDVDCHDADCFGPACAEVCDDALDNDGDGASDCDDADCFGSDCAEVCDDTLDNDGDGWADCDDVDCTDLCEEDCSDGVDNDADGSVDCLDVECVGQAVCLEDCGDNRDNDGDGRVDCEDGDCVGAPACTEDCADGALQDEDLDGLVDCEDDDCWGESVCEGQVLLSLDSGRAWGIWRGNHRAGAGARSWVSSERAISSASGTARVVRSSTTVRCDVWLSSAAWSATDWYTATAIDVDLVGSPVLSTTGACGLGAIAVPDRLIAYSFFGTSTGAFPFAHWSTRSVDRTSMSFSSGSGAGWFRSTMLSVSQYGTLGPGHAFVVP